MERFYRSVLLMAPGIGAARLRKLMEFFGDSQAVWSAGTEALRRSRLLSEEQVAAIADLRQRLDVGDVSRRWTEEGIGLCVTEDEVYPTLLRNIYDPPPVLFYKGRLNSDSLYFSVVGSRRATPYGRNVARSFCGKLAQAGVVVVSGAARGIDTAAHEGALSVGAPTVAVLACGVDVAYPPENSFLLKRIAENGCVLSEYPPGTPPLPGRFPARNRIIAGMSPGVLVVEAAEKSGALITADFALNENREVYAVPGSIFSGASRGAHRLIQQGARLVDGVGDLLEDLGFPPAASTERPQEVLGTMEKKLLRELSHADPLSADELVERLGVDASQVLVLLLQLEMAGYVRRESCMGYIRVAKE